LSIKKTRDFKVSVYIEQGITPRLEMLGKILELNIQTIPILELNI